MFSSNSYYKQACIKIISTFIVNRVIFTGKIMNLQKSEGVLSHFGGEFVCWKTFRGYEIEVHPGFGNIPIWQRSEVKK